MGKIGKIHIDLADDGFEGQWLDLQDIGLFSPKEFKELAAIDDTRTADGARLMIGKVVTAWHIERRDGTELPAPDSPDLDPDDIPLRIAARIKAEVTQQGEDIQNLKARSRSA